MSYDTRCGDDDEKCLVNGDDLLTYDTSVTSSCFFSNKYQCGIQ